MGAGADLKSGRRIIKELSRPGLGLTLLDQPEGAEVILDFGVRTDRRDEKLTVYVPYSLPSLDTVQAHKGKLKEHGEYIIGGIRSSVGGAHVKRPELLTRLLEVSETSKFVFISGGRGIGKSSLAREPVRSCCIEVECFTTPVTSNQSLQRNRLYNSAAVFRGE